MNSHIDESRDVTVTDMGETISVFVPISWKRTGGRKQIVLPDEPHTGEQSEDKPSPLVIALARAYVWQKWIDEGKYANAKDLASGVEMDSAQVRRILRLGIIPPSWTSQLVQFKEAAPSQKDIEDLLSASEPVYLWPRMLHFHASPGADI